MKGNKYNINNNGFDNKIKEKERNIKMNSEQK